MRISRIAGWSAVTMIALLLLTPYLLPLVSGHRLIRVDGGSMAPTLQPGDFIITAPPSGDDLHSNAVLVIGTPPHAYTHRVIDTRRDGDVSEAKMRGDANTVADPGWVSQDSVYAVVIGSIDGTAAGVIGFVTGPPGTVVLAIVLIALLVGLIPVSTRQSR